MEVNDHTSLLKMLGGKTHSFWKWDDRYCIGSPHCSIKDTSNSWFCHEFGPDSPQFTKFLVKNGRRWTHTFCTSWHFWEPWIYLIGREGPGPQKKEQAYMCIFRTIVATFFKMYGNPIVIIIQSCILTAFLKSYVGYCKELWVFLK